MFERFTEAGRGVVIRARDEAQRLGHGYIGTEHLLLVLLDQDSGVAYTVLRGAGLDRERVRADIVRLVGTGTGPLDEGDAEALRAIGIDLPTVRAKIEEVFGPGALDPPCPPPRPGLLRRRGARSGGGRIPFTAAAKKVLVLSLREATGLRHNHLGPEHLLLGLLREDEGLAVQILAEAGLSLEDLHARTVMALNRAA